MKKKEQESREKEDQYWREAEVPSSKKSEEDGFTFTSVSFCETSPSASASSLHLSGGVTSMDSFLKRFFPSVNEMESNLKPSSNQYCKFNSQILTLLKWSRVFLVSTVVL